eukprot:538459_1
MPTPSPTSVTSIPTTSIPTTSIPTTSNPTTSIPTTSNPTTLSPTQRPSIPPTKARETTADGFFEIVNYNNKKGDGNIYNWWLIITLIILLVLSVGGIIIGVIFYKRNKNAKIDDSMAQNVEMEINEPNTITDGNDDDYHIVQDFDTYNDKTPMDIEQRNDDEVVQIIYQTTIVNSEKFNNYEDVVEMANQIDETVKDYNITDLHEHGEKNALVEGVKYDMNEDGGKQVRTWLQSIGFSKYYDNFVQNAFDS